MLTPNQVSEIRRMLADGQWSQRDIAQRTGVSRGSVHAIAAGKRPERDATPNPNADEPPGIPVRCPTCGGLVYAPCVLCRVRNRKAEESRRGSPRDRRQAPPAWPTAEDRERPADSR